jgi:hypothetical protein
MTYLMAAFCGGKIICTIKGTFQLHPKKQKKAGLCVWETEKAI